MNAPLTDTVTTQFVRAPKAGLAPSLERKRLQVHIAQMVLDIAALLGGFALGGLIYAGGIEPTGTLLAAQLLLPLYLTIALYNGTYSLRSLTDWRAASLQMLYALANSALLLTFISFFGQIGSAFPRVAIALGLMIAAAMMVMARYFAVQWLSRIWGPAPMNILIIEEDGGPPMDLPHAYRISAAEHGLEPALEDPHALDRLARYMRNMDQVIVSCPPDRRGLWAQILKGSGFHGEVLSSTVHQIGALGVVHRERAGASSLLVSTGPLGLRARITKRLLDIALSAVALLALSPVLMAAMLAIKLEDGGPIFFRQRRLGRGNRFFMIYKLRTMKVDQADADGKRSASRGDDRITRIGRLLRRTSVDELPQLLNVLNGEMSLVGPRPHALGSCAGTKLFWEVDRRYWQRHCLKPGLTGLAQVRGFRGATPTESDLSSRLQADLEYVAGWTLWRDIGIMVSTLKVVIHERAF